MASFYVGQRVKKVRGEYNIGATGVVIGVGIYAHGPNGRKFEVPADLLVRMDSDWLNCFGHRQSAADPSYCDSWKFEPILPDGLESKEDALKLWEPEGMEVRA